jgi:signal transduction histidine kinase
LESGPPPAALRRSIFFSSTCRPIALIDEAVEAVQAAFAAKHHTLRIETPQAPVVLELDPVRMTQVITNVLANAAKYTPPGGVIQLGTRLEGNFSSSACATTASA